MKNIFMIYIFCYHAVFCNFTYAQGPQSKKPWYLPHTQIINSVQNNEPKPFEHFRTETCPILFEALSLGALVTLFSPFIAAIYLSIERHSISLNTFTSALLYSFMIALFGAMITTTFYKGELINYTLNELISHFNNSFNMYGEYVIQNDFLKNNLDSLINRQVNIKMYPILEKENEKEKEKEKEKEYSMPYGLNPDIVYQGVFQGYHVDKDGNVTEIIFELENPSYNNLNNDKTSIVTIPIKAYSDNSPYLYTIQTVHIETKNIPLNFEFLKYLLQNHLGALLELSKSNPNILMETSATDGLYFLLKDTYVTHEDRTYEFVVKKESNLYRLYQVNPLPLDTKTLNFIRDSNGKNHIDPSVKKPSEPILIMDNFNSNTNTPYRILRLEDMFNSDDPNRISFQVPKSVLQKNFTLNGEPTTISQLHNQWLMERASRFPNQPVTVNNLGEVFLTPLNTMSLVQTIEEHNPKNIPNQTDDFSIYEAIKDTLILRNELILGEKILIKENNNP